MPNPRSPGEFIGNNLDGFARISVVFIPNAYTFLNADGLRIILQFVYPLIKQSAEITLNTDVKDIEDGKLLGVDNGKVVGVQPNIFVLSDPDTVQEIVTPLSAGQSSVSIPGDTYTYFEFTTPFTGYLKGYIKISFSGNCEAMMCLQRKKSNGDWPDDPTIGVAFAHEMSTYVLVGGLNDIAVLGGETYRIGVALFGIGSAKTCVPDSRIWISKPMFVAQNAQ